MPDSPEGRGLRRKTTRSVSANPSAACILYKAKMSSLASDANSEHPRCRRARRWRGVSSKTASDRRPLTSFYPVQSALPGEDTKEEMANIKRGRRR